MPPYASKLTKVSDRIVMYGRHPAKQSKKQEKAINPDVDFPNSSVPRVAVGLCIGGLTDPSNHAKGVGGDETHETGNQESGGQHCARRISVNGNSVGQTQDARSDHALVDQVKDFVGNGGCSIALDCDHYGWSFPLGSRCCWCFCGWRSANGNFGKGYWKQ